MTEAAVVQDPVVAVPVEHTYTYQPTDESGNNLGGLQVIKYDGTPGDLGKKMSEQNNELIKLNRRLKRDLRLGNIAAEQIPDDAPRFDESKFQLTPQPLTFEERIQLAQDINDPEKLAAVSDRFVRASIGDPEALRARIARLEQQASKSNALEEAQAFVRANPSYYPHEENYKTIQNWIVKNKLEPVLENYQRAFDALGEFMVPRPQPAAVVPPTVVPDPPPATPPPVRPVSSGLTRSNGSDSGPAPNLGITRAEVDKMSGDDYKKRLLHEPGFRAKVEALDKAESDRRRQANA